MKPEGCYYYRHREINGTLKERHF